MGSAGQYQCSSQMYYTPTGQEALIDMTKALNVRVKKEQKVQHTQEQEQFHGKLCGVTLRQTTFTIQNFKGIDVELVMDFVFAGEVLSRDPPLKKNVEKPSIYNPGPLNMNRGLQW